MYLYALFYKKLDVLLVYQFLNCLPINPLCKYVNIYQIFMSKDQHNTQYYLKCMVGGALACGLTHLLIVPLDVMKCRKQVDNNYCSGIFDGVKKVSKANQLTLGWIPTLVGYSIQGSGKFGFYEIFKDVYKKFVGEKNAEKYKKVGWSVASASA